MCIGMCISVASQWKSTNLLVPVHVQGIVAINTCTEPLLELHSTQQKTCELFSNPLSLSSNLLSTDALDTAAEVSSSLTSVLGFYVSSWRFSHGWTLLLT